MNKDLLFSLLPARYIELIEKDAKLAHIRDYKKITLFSLFLVPLISIIIVLSFNFSILIHTLILLTSIPLAFFIPHAIMSLQAERRKKEIEEVLPDALLLMSSNIKSGLTIDKAFLFSAREEFGPLAEEIQLAAMKIFSGRNVEDVLDDMQENTNSEVYKEVLGLISNGIRAGGELSKLLESSARSIRKTMLIQKEAESNVKVYAIFITMAALFAAPFLFAISNYLSETTAFIWSSSQIDLEKIPSQGFLKISKPDFNPQTIKNFSLVVLSIISFSSALIISEIRTGSAKNGFKTAPLFLIVALAMYYICQFVIQKLFSGLVAF
jgi:hypothetical protein